MSVFDVEKNTMYETKSQEARCFQSQSNDSINPANYAAIEISSGFDALWRILLLRFYTKLRTHSLKSKILYALMNRLQLICYTNTL